MGDNGIDGTDLIDGIEFAFVIKWTLVWPIVVGDKGSVWLLKMEVFGTHKIGAVDRGRTTTAEDGVSAGFYHRIVWECHPPMMLDNLQIEIGRIIVVATNEKQVIVDF